MRQKGFANTILILITVVIVGVGTYFALDRKNYSPEPGPKPVACTQEAKECPDGSYVGRVGPNCEFAKCPTTSPVGRDCSGLNDLSCGAGYGCVERCGPPIVREGDTHPGYFCQPEGYVPFCPICLSKNTLIDTPTGEILVQQLEVGMPVWTVNKVGERVAGVVKKTSRVQVPPNHKVVVLILADGRQLFVSPGHPIIDGRVVGDLVSGALYDGARVVEAELVMYGDEATYDLLPSGETGFYFAGGILLDSTLH